MVFKDASRIFEGSGSYDIEFKGIFGKSGIHNFLLCGLT